MQAVSTVPSACRLVRAMRDHASHARHGIGDAAKNGPLAEAKQSGEKDGSGDLRHEPSLMLARLGRCALANAELSNASGSAAVLARRRRTKEADKARDASQPLVEAHFLSNAISAPGALARSAPDRRAGLQDGGATWRTSVSTSPIHGSVAAGRRGIEQAASRSFCSLRG
jgi:hypothetical protein